jgi:tRNA (guanine37-N1)-methyltransferase
MTRTIWIISLFEEYFHPLMNHGRLSTVFSDKAPIKIEMKFINPREYSPNNYKSVDDYPYGGGPGMVMRADILKSALQAIVDKGEYGEDYQERLHIVYPGPRGKVWNNLQSKAMAEKIGGDFQKDLVFVCGRYEGIDERFLSKYVDEEISVGDFVLSGGEIAVLTILDSSLRFISGVLGNEESSRHDSFEDGVLEYPQFTRPKSFEDFEVPEILLSGHHEKISQYRESEKLRVTKNYRPDLLEKGDE